MGKNLTGGDFFGAVPKEGFGSGNPCTMQGSCHKTCSNTDVAGNRAELEHSTTRAVPYQPELTDQLDDPRFDHNQPKDVVMGAVQAK